MLAGVFWVDWEHWFQRLGGLLEGRQARKNRQRQTRSRDAAFGVLESLAAVASCSLVSNADESARACCSLA